MYVIGIKRRFWFGYKTYRCKSYRIKASVQDDLPDGSVRAAALPSPALQLTLVNDSVLLVPHIYDRGFKIRTLPVKAEKKARRSDGPTWEEINALVLAQFQAHREAIAQEQQLTKEAISAAGPSPAELHAKEQAWFAEQDRLKELGRAISPELHARQQAAANREASRQSVARAPVNVPLRAPAPRPQPQPDPEPDPDPAPLAESVHDGVLATATPEDLEELGVSPAELERLRTPGAGPARRRVEGAPMTRAMSRAFAGLAEEQ